MKERVILMDAREEGRAEGRAEGWAEGERERLRLTTENEQLRKEIEILKAAASS